MLKMPDLNTDGENKISFIKEVTLFEGGHYLEVMDLGIRFLFSTEVHALICLKGFIKLK